MVSLLIQNTLVQVSCLLSMIGASIVALTWAYPKDNRKKHGRILLLWLSIADFLSSLVYFIQTFTLSAPDRGIYCKVAGLIGIFFPVASFLWTDFIAYYLYSVVVYRHFYLVDDWNNLLRRFHIIAWGVPLFIIILVAGLGHAGRNNELSNTGGWCWIYAPTRSQEILWEFIGGKCIEWASCFIILPYLYAKAGLRLIYYDRQSLRRKYPAKSEENDLLVPINNQSSERLLSPEIIDDTDVAIPVISDDYSDNTPELNFSSKDYSLQSRQLLSESIRSPMTDLDDSKATFAHEDDMKYSDINLTRHSTLASSHRQTFGTRSTNQRNKGTQQFSKFYIKMAALPLIFFFIRFWGSIRVFANYFGCSQSVDQVFGVMQSICDPSQGFVNALVFVFGSKGGSRQAVVALGMFVDDYLKWIPGSSTISSKLISSGEGAENSSNHQVSPTIPEFVIHRENGPSSPVSSVNSDHSQGYTVDSYIADLTDSQSGGSFDTRFINNH